MRHWAIDANEFRLGEDFSKFPLYRNSKVDEYLNIDSADRFIIYAPKGLGKTLLLKMKSWKYRNEKKDSVVCFPEDQLCEKLLTQDYSLSREDLDQFRDSEQWMTVWRIALSVAILKRLKIKLPDEVEKVFGDESFSVSSHLQKVISNRRGLSQFGQMFWDHLEHRLRLITQPIALFLDNADEAFQRHTGERLREHETLQNMRLGFLSDGVWKKAQIGLIGTAIELNQLNRHIKVFTAIRYEAVQSYDLSTKHNLSTWCTDLKYSRSDLRKIFERKLALMKQDDLNTFKNPDDEDLVSGFLGHAKCEHQRVRDINGKPLVEDVFDAILRHTRSRPRELEDIGETIELLIPSADRNEERVRELVNNKSNEFFGFAQGEALPYWPPEYVSDFFGLIPCNILTPVQKKSIVKRFKSKCRDAPEPFEFLFKHGLIGCTTRRTGHPLRQRFQVYDPEEPVTIDEFVSADYFLIHPCLDTAIHAANPRYQPDRRNVVGHGMDLIFPFHPLHVHIGAGKLACGLVLPLFANSLRVPLCVLQRPSRDWSHLVNPANSKPAKHVTVMLQGAGAVFDETKFSLLHDALSDSLCRKLIGDWESGMINIFALTENQAIVERILEKAKTISTAVGGKNLLELIPKYFSKSRRSKIHIFPFENKFDAVRDFRKALEDKSNYVVCPVVADRICTERKINGDGTISVYTEPYMSVIVHTGDAEIRRLLDGTHGINTVQKQQEFDFEHQKKYLLVNGIHAATAILGYELLIHEGVDATNWSAALFRLITSNSDIALKMKALSRVFIGILIAKKYQNNRDINCSELNFELSSYFDAVWNRMRSTPDALTRILPSDDSNLFQKYSSFFSNLKLQVDIDLSSLSKMKLRQIPNSTDAKVAVSYITDAFVALLLHQQSHRN